MLPCGLQDFRQWRKMMFHSDSWRIALLMRVDAFLLIVFNLQVTQTILFAMFWTAKKQQVQNVTFWSLNVDAFSSINQKLKLLSLIAVAKAMRHDPGNLAVSRLGHYSSLPYIYLSSIINNNQLDQTVSFCFDSKNYVCILIFSAIYMNGWNILIFTPVLLICGFPCNLLFMTAADQQWPH